jgi:hypothetical protein
MELYNIVRHHLKGNIPDMFEILRCMENSGIYFIKVRHSSGRVCYTYTDIKPSNPWIKLREIKGNGPSASLKGTYDVIVPSCDGAVEESHNTIAVIKVRPDFLSEPTYVTLYDDSSDSPARCPIVYPLVSPERLSEESWMNRYDEMLISCVYDMSLTLEEKCEQAKEISYYCDTFKEGLCREMLEAKRSMDSAVDEETYVACINTLHLCISVARNIENLGQNLAPMLESMKIRCPGV